MPDINVAPQSNLLDSISLKDRVALVTGGSRGIGRAAVQCFAKLGANVVVNFVRDEGAAQQTVSEAEARGVGALAVQADVSDSAQAQRLVEATVKRFGRVDFLVCNAGIWEGSAIDQMTEEVWDRTIHRN